MVTYALIHRFFAALCFIVAFIVYYVTMQPTVSFWDCGEFASAAWALQIPHPPGSPLWTLLGRVAMLLPTNDDIVARYNLFSVLFSAGAISLLYLTAVKLIQIVRGSPKTVTDAIILFGSAIVASFTYMFTDSFWFNALECEVYALTMFSLALIVWLVLVWSEKTEEKYSERYLMLISYLVGLTLGIHQMVVLTIPTIVLLLYFRVRKVDSIFSILRPLLISVGVFIIVYKIVLTYIVSFLAITPVIPILCIGILIGGIIYSSKKRLIGLNLGLWSLSLVIIGYTTYALILIRSGQEPPMNQNDPSTFKQFQHYLNRDQYGDRGFFPRRTLDEFGQKTGPTWDPTKYSSDLDFFWKFQVDHMSNRYLYWNYIGREDTKQEAGTDWGNTWGIIFFIGIVGMIWHFRTDPKRAIAFLFLFLTLGLVAALFQNSQDPSARERDYFYVGAYYVFAIWIAFGVVEIYERIANKLAGDIENNDTERAASNRRLVYASTVVALSIVVCPLNQLFGFGGLLSGRSLEQTSRWSQYSRQNNFVAFDCAYNILQSCDKDAILFTYGDNDTYPLWCLQDVYGIRRDVRVILLSMANVSWYIQQIKNSEPWGAKKILLTSSMFSDNRLEEMANSDDPFALKSSVKDARYERIPISAVSAQQITGDKSRSDTALVWKYIGAYDSGNKFVFTVADELTYDIIRSNINSRPIYFSVTVPENNRIGLDRNLSAEGLALRVTPDIFEQDNSGYGGGVHPEKIRKFLLESITTPQKTPQRGSIIRSYNTKSGHVTYTDKNFAFNYVMAYMRYAENMLLNGDKAEAKITLDKMQQVLSPDAVVSDVYPADIISQLYYRCDDDENARRFSTLAKMMLITDDNKLAINAPPLQKKYRLGNLLLLEGDLHGASSIYTELLGATADKGTIEQMKLRLQEVDARAIEKKGDTLTALSMYENILRTREKQVAVLSADFKPLYYHVQELKRKLVPVTK